MIALSYYRRMTTDRHLCWLPSSSAAVFRPDDDGSQHSLVATRRIVSSCRPAAHRPLDESSSEDGGQNVWANHQGTCCARSLLKNPCLSVGDTLAVSLQTLLVTLMRLKVSH